MVAAGSILWELPSQILSFLDKFSAKPFLSVRGGLILLESPLCLAAVGVAEKRLPIALVRLSARVNT